MSTKTSKRVSFQIFKEYRKRDEIVINVTSEEFLSNYQDPKVKCE